jgi:type I restriction enzyme M protein
MTTARTTKSSPASVAADYQSELWQTANALRGSMDAAEYKHVVLGLIFLKYVSDAFGEARARIEALSDEGADPEDPDEYRGDNIFWVPPRARWPYLQRSARQSQIGRLVDEAMAAIEHDNPVLDGVLPKDYARPALDQARLGQVVDLVSNIRVGGAEAEAIDVLGEVYEYFLEQFALAEGRKGGEFYTSLFATYVTCQLTVVVELPGWMSRLHRCPDRLFRGGGCSGRPEVAANNSSCKVSRKFGGEKRPYRAMLRRSAPLSAA